MFVCGFTVVISFYYAIIKLNADIKKRNGRGRALASEFNARVDIVELELELVKVLFAQGSNYENVVYVSQMYGLCGKPSNGFVSNAAMKEVSESWGHFCTHSSTMMFLYEVLVIEDEVAHVENYACV